MFLRIPKFEIFIGSLPRLIFGKILNKSKIRLIIEKCLQFRIWNYEFVKICVDRLKSLQE